MSADAAHTLLAIASMAQSVALILQGLALHRLSRRIDRRIDQLPYALLSSPRRPSL